MVDLGSNPRGALNRAFYNRRNGMEKITELTAEQESRFDEFVDKWIKIGLDTSRPNDDVVSLVATDGTRSMAKMKTN